ncbi:hypothetical protein B0O99DRAFT_735819 [Bisporella sp. PMI_857]|nr:hypothetical protein B0O99DRAFT_735819 [Bisporella sp. PMI_857]
MDSRGFATYPVGFTPVRRRLSTINSTQLKAEPEIEWTAKRCNRLLRALSSRVALLKKDLYKLQHCTQEQTSIQDPTAKAERKRGCGEGDNEEWNAGKKQLKRVKRTYSARPGRPSKAAIEPKRRSRPWLSEDRFIPGDISVPTPVLNRAWGEITVVERTSPLSFGEDVDSIQQQAATKPRGRPKINEGDGQHRLAGSMRELKKKLSMSQYSVYEGIYHGLEALLRATVSCNSNPKMHGPQSLLATCLRAVPQYISLEEEFHEKELLGVGRSIDNKDISTEVYNDLEAFGSHGHGWKQLRIVVRSHGTKVLSDAILAGLLDIGFCGILIRLCTELSAKTEAELLLSSLLSSNAIFAPTSIYTRFYDDRSALPLSMLWRYSEIQNSVSFKYRQLADMIAEDRLPLGWLATKEFSIVWARAIQELSSPAVDAQVIRFFGLALGRLAILPHRDDHHGSDRELVPIEAAKQVFSGLLTTISSIVILSNNACNQSMNATSATDLLDYRHLTRLLQSCLLHWKVSGSSTTQGTLLLLANAAIQSETTNIIMSHDLAELLVSQLRNDKNASQFSSTGVDPNIFICSIARCCGRGTRTLGFDHLEQIHMILESLATHAREPSERTVLQELIVDSAFAFAQQMSDSKILDYATKTEAKFHVIKTKLATGATPKSACGFRWEEGISEWVTATPAAHKSKLGKARRVQEIKDGKEGETPSRSPSPQPLANSTSSRGRSPSRKSEAGDEEYDDSRFSLSLNKPQIIIKSKGMSLSLSLENESGTNFLESQSCDDSFTSARSVSTSASHSNVTSPRSRSRAPMRPRGSFRNRPQSKNETPEQSDDELSFYEASSQEELVLRDITNRGEFVSRRHCRKASKLSLKMNAGTDPITKNKVSAVTRRVFVEDSEDELCI